jgi:hypothetical protein
MALVDPNIAMGYRGVEIPNQLAQYGQVQQIMAARDAQQINALKMQEAQAALDERNALRRLNPSAPDYESQLFKVNPQLGINYRKEAATTAAQEATRKKAEFDLIASRRKFGDELKRNLSANPSNENVVAWGQDAVLQGIYTEDQVAATVQQLLAIPPEQRVSILARSGATASELKPSTQTVNRAGATDIVQIPAFSGAPSTLGSYADVPLPANVQAQKIQIAQQSRPPAQPVAPTITSIVDPANPNQMITIDARRYQGGGAGAPGVIGVAGKEPGAALRTNKVEEGKTQLQNDLDNLRSSFTELDRLRAIPSTERNVVSNLMSATAASGVGQALGRAGGSPEQVERDVINSARQRLVASIKNATGMSSKSLDSNMELQTMLRSISDPGQSVEAAFRIIDDIENAYVKGSGTLPKPSKPAAAVAPNIDALLKKYENK